MALLFLTINNIELKSFTDVAIDERTESEVSKSKFKAKAEEKVQKDSVKLESFNDVDIEKKKSEVTEGKFKTDNLVNIKSRKFATSKLSNSL